MPLTQVVSEPTEEPAPKVTVAFVDLTGTPEMLESRVGRPDRVFIEFTQTVNARIESISVNVKQDLLEYDVVARPYTANRWMCPIKFRKPGPAELIARAKWNADGDVNVQVAVSRPASVNIAATVRALVVVRLNGKAAENGRVATPIPIVGQTNIRIEVVAPHAAAVQAECREPSRIGAITLFLRTAAAADPWVGNLVLPETAAPVEPDLFLRDTDYFGETLETKISFSTADVTPPRITIIAPAEDDKFLVDSSITSINPLKIPVRGTIRDVQSGYAMPITLFAAGQSFPIPEVNANAEWRFELPVWKLGVYEITVSASDNKNNIGNSAQDNRRQFELVPSFKPLTLEELLGPAAYLRELQRFVRGHITKPDSVNTMTRVAVGSTDLEGAFRQPIGDVGWTDPALASRSISELLTPIRVLRDIDRARILDPAANDFNRSNRTCADAAGLVARWNFADLQLGAPAGMVDVAGRYQVNGNYHGAGARTEYIERMRGGGELEGALVLDSQSYAEVSSEAARHLLQVGRDNQNFSVSFWIYPQDARSTGSNESRSIIFKGHEQPVRNRTFGIWLRPDSNAVLFRVTTSDQPDSGGQSSMAIPVGRWTHLACVKTGQRLHLFIDGRLDASVNLTGMLIPNTDSLYIGRNPTTNNGFNGGISEVRIYDFALEPDAVEALALERLVNLPFETTGEYTQTAYETMLRAIGTSLEEMRGLQDMTQSRRQELAERLGLTYPNQAGDLLDRLMPTGDSGADAFEEWLAKRFGLPQTFTPSEHLSDVLAFSEIVRDRHDSLSYRWKLEDQIHGDGPDVDPDLVNVVDLTTKATEWVSMLRSREAEVAQQFGDFRGKLQSSGAAIAIGEVYSPEEFEDFRRLSEREKAGNSIVEELPRFSLDLTMFRRLMTYVKRPNARFTQYESEDLAHLLTQIWKLRKRYADWAREEASIPARLWPSSAAEAAWVPGSFKRTFSPWRANARKRSDLERRLAARIREWQAIEDAQAQAVADTQRQTLPALRDRLLGISDLPSTQSLLDDLTNRWLVDFGASGSTVTTQVEQAIASLQTVVNGVRGAWFEAGHPAHDWAPREVTLHDKQWAWIDSYERWKAAVLNYLYPENVLFPELRAANSDKFALFLQELGKLQPISASQIETNESLRNAYDAVYREGTAVDAPAARRAEAEVFMPIAIGLALQRAGLYTKALENYGKIYNRTAVAANRTPYEPLASEPALLPPTVGFGTDSWAVDLEDPHKQAGKSGCTNPYTRFTLFQILNCLLAQADDAFASGTHDGRTLALGLYLEARDILGYKELQDVPPADILQQAYLPSPVCEAFRAHADGALRKLRRGLSFLGTPMPPESTRNSGSGVLSNLVRSTPYKYRVLIERSKQLVAQSQQLEAQYFSALERGDSEAEKLITQGFALDNAKQFVQLRSLQETEAANGIELARRQQYRSQIQRDRYSDWILTGQIEGERNQIESIQAASTWRQISNAADTVVANLQAAASTSSVVELASSFGARAALAAAIDVAVIGRGVAQAGVIERDTNATLQGIQASQERRRQEWGLSHDLAEQDIGIGYTQIVLAHDRSAIAAHESAIAETQKRQSEQMLAFLRNRFSSAAFYQWLIGELSQIYATFLRLAAATAKHAELQLAFERQEQPAGYIRADYWQLATSSARRTSGQSANANQSANATDPRGITGSARLLQDIYLLDERAFNSERRLLNLSQNFSLSRLMPIEFEEFRRTGYLTISTPMRWFDEGFPGHFMRLIKKVRLSISALVPSNQGIRATLANSGMSRVVTADAGFPTVVIRQDPQIVALTSPIAATGVFEFDAQSDLLYPFEGTGVDTTWFLELPPAGNPFDFNSLGDVVLTIDYTAQFSPELRELVIKRLPRQYMGDLVFSVKRDLPDAWYELANGTGASAHFALPIAMRNFPPGLSELSIDEIAISARTTEGQPCDFVVELSIPPSGSVPPLNRGPVTAIKGIASSRQGAGSSWHRIGSSRVIDGLGEASVPLEFAILDRPAETSGDSTSILEQLREGKVQDILIVITFAGQRPAWT